MSTTVFISGANGFIAKQIVHQLLEGGYKVIGSVRSESKGDRVLEQFNNPNFKYIVIEDLQNPEAFSILKDYPEITKFLHTASPLISEPDIEQLIGPTVEGTINALTSIHKYGKNITNVVVTSTIATVFKIHEPKEILDDEDWSDITEEDGANGGLLGYFLSKTIAERAAWKFVNDNKPNFKLATVLPSLVTGPQTFDDDITETLGGSAEIINALITKAKFELLLDTTNFIDVRDVARAHIVAFEKDLQQRLLLTNTSISGKDIIDVLQTRYPERTFPILEQKYSKITIDDSRTRDALDFDYIGFEKSVLDSAEQIVEVNAK